MLEIFLIQFVKGVFANACSLLVTRFVSRLTSIKHRSTTDSMTLDQFAHFAKGSLKQLLTSQIFAVILFIAKGFKSSFNLNVEGIFKSVVTKVSDEMLSFDFIDGEKILSAPILSKKLRTIFNHMLEEAVDDFTDNVRRQIISAFINKKFTTPDEFRETCVSGYPVKLDQTYTVGLDEVSTDFYKKLLTYSLVTELYNSSLMDTKLHNPAVAAAMGLGSPDSTFTLRDYVIGHKSDSDYLSDMGRTMPHETFVTNFQHLAFATELAQITPTDMLDVSTFEARFNAINADTYHIITLDTWEGNSFRKTLDASVLICTALGAENFFNEERSEVSMEKFDILYLTLLNTGLDITGDLMEYIKGLKKSNDVEATISNSKVLDINGLQQMLIEYEGEQQYGGEKMPMVEDRQDSEIDDVLVENMHVVDGKQDLGINDVLNGHKKTGKNGKLKK